MATRIATADGNFTTAGTWGVVDATSLVNSEVSFVTLTTAYVESAAFTPGAITADGLAVKVYARPGSSGTISVRLAQGGALVAGTEVTINVTDIAPISGQQQWLFFKFAAPVLLVVATAYTLSAKTSAGTLVTLYRDATANNYSRMLRTTTTGAPAAGDSFHVLGEWTAAATKTDRVVTMDSTAATDYGDGVVANPPGFTVGNGGTLTWGVAAATNYILRLSTNMVVGFGGTKAMGTVGAKMPIDSSAVLEFDCAVADGDFGLYNYGTFIMQGRERTAGKLVVRCLLNTDEAAGQTVLGVNTDTGWLNGDEIAIASTTRTPTQAELRALSVDAGAATLTVSAGLTNAHSGTTPTQAEVILLTRNVRVKSVSATFMSFVHCGVGSVTDLDWAGFRYLGSTVTPKRGVEVASPTSFECSYCSIAEFDVGGLVFNSADHNNFSVDHLVGYKVGVSTFAGLHVVATTGLNWTLSDIDLIGGSASATLLLLGSYGGTLTNINCNSGSVGVNLARVQSSPESIHKTWSGFVCHSNQGAGVQVDGLDFGVLHNVVIWRGGGAAGGLFLTAVADLVINGGEFFGNATYNVDMATSSGPRGLTLRNVNLNGDTSFATTNGLSFGSAGGINVKLRCENCTFGVVAGIKTAHTQDIVCTAGSPRRYGEITLINTKLSSATPILDQGHLRGRSFIRYQRVNQVTNVHKTVWPALGTVAYDAAVFRTSAPSESLTPSGTGVGAKLQSGPRRVPVASGATVTVSVYVRKSAAYTGSAPRLIQRANPALGVDDEVVLDTHTAGADTWEQLTGTTAAAEEGGACEFYVDCDGSAGVVYVDEWTGA